MRERILPDGVRLSKIALGTGGYGTGFDDKTAFEQMDAYYAAGGRTLDTARVYGLWAPGGDGASEKCVGRWLASRGVRDEITVSTKGAHPELHDVHISRMTAENIDKDLHESLAFLGVERIDLYFLHRDDVTLPVSYIMDALDIPVKQGLIRVLGASNWSKRRIDEANAYALANGKTPFSVSQIEWNAGRSTPGGSSDDTLVNMYPDEYAAYAADTMAVMAFSSQAKGLFAKLAEGKPLRPMLAAQYDNDYNRAKLARLRAIADRKGASVAQIGLAEILCDPINGTAIIGASSMEQLRESLAAEEIRLTRDELAFLQQ